MVDDRFVIRTPCMLAARPQVEPAALASEEESSMGQPASTPGRRTPGGARSAVRRGSKSGASAEGGGLVCSIHQSGRRRRKAIQDRHGRWCRLPRPRRVGAVEMSLATKKGDACEAEGSHATQDQDKTTTIATIAQFKWQELKKEKAALQSEIQELRSAVHEDKEAAEELSLIKEQLQRRHLYDEFCSPAALRLFRIKKQVKSGRVKVQDVKNEELPKGWSQVIDKNGKVECWMAPDIAVGDGFRKVQNAWHAVDADGLTYAERSYVPGSRLHINTSVAERAARAELESNLIRFSRKFQDLKPTQNAPTSEGARIIHLLKSLDDFTKDSAQASSQHVLKQCGVIACGFKKWPGTKDCRWGKQLAKELVTALQNGQRMLLPYEKSEPWLQPAQTVAAVSKPQQVDTKPTAPPSDYEIEKLIAGYHGGWFETPAQEAIGLFRRTRVVPDYISPNDL